MIKRTTKNFGTYEFRLKVTHVIKRAFRFRHFEIILILLPLKDLKTEKFEELLGFAQSHSIVTRSLVSLSCATTPQPSRFSKS